MSLYTLYITCIIYVHILLTRFSILIDKYKHVCIHMNRGVYAYTIYNNI